MKKELILHINLNYQTLIDIFFCIIMTKRIYTHPLITERHLRWKIEVMSASNSATGYKLRGNELNNDVGFARSRNATLPDDEGNVDWDF